VILLSSIILRFADLHLEFLIEFKIEKMMIQKVPVY